MPRTARVVPWLSEVEMIQWLREAPSVGAYQKRLAVWLTVVGPFYAHQIAEMLGVSKQAVWLWLGQYNKFGPGGLERKGRGGRRWAFLGWEEEEELLRSLEKRAILGQVITAKQLLPEICKEVGKEVSLWYVYRLLKRHNWRKLGPRPRHLKADPTAQEQFKKNSRPSSRKP
jgi:transposase